LAHFRQELASAKFGSVVFDYDGTLCGTENRFGLMNPDVSAELARLLKAQIFVGVATGRGKSVRKALQESIPREFWHLVLVGYYNGAQIATLSDTNQPDGTAEIDERLVEVQIQIQSNSRLKKIAKITQRRLQISIEANGQENTDECWGIATNMVHSLCNGNVKLVRSSHSFDILPAAVSKLDVVRKIIANNGETLTIGDMGRWPGNDFELLSHKYSLSVEHASESLDSCWNLSPPGVLGEAATLFYLKSMKTNSRGFFRLRMADSKKGK